MPPPHQPRLQTHMQNGDGFSVSHSPFPPSCYLSVSPSQIFSAEKTPPFVSGEGGREVGGVEEEKRGGERRGEEKRTVSLNVYLEYEWEINRCVYVISDKSVLWQVKNTTVFVGGEKTGKKREFVRASAFSLSRKKARHPVFFFFWLGKTSPRVSLFLHLNKETNRLPKVHAKMMHSCAFTEILQSSLL